MENNTFNQVIQQRITPKYSQKYVNLRTNLTRVARSTAPVDTGNLKKNAIYSMQTPKGFRIVWDKRFAYYLPFVDEATVPFSSPKIEANKGFVQRGIVSVLYQIYKIQKGKNTPFRNYKNNKSYINIPYVYDVMKTYDPENPVLMDKGAVKMFNRFANSVKQSDQLVPYMDSQGEVTELDNS